MKIAILQFSPRLGEVAANFSRAESLLMRDEREGMLENVDLLVLPELAFTGNQPPLPSRQPSRLAKDGGVRPRPGLMLYPRKCRIDHFSRL